MVDVWPAKWHAHYLLKPDSRTSLIPGSQQTSSNAGAATIMARRLWRTCAIQQLGNLHNQLLRFHILLPRQRCRISVLGVPYGNDPRIVNPALSWFKLQRFIIQRQSSALNKMAVVNQQQLKATDVSSPRKCHKTSGKANMCCKHLNQFELAPAKRGVKTGEK